MRWQVGLLLLLLPLLAACTGTGPHSSRKAIPPDVMPLVASESRFVDAGGLEWIVRLEPGPEADCAVMTVTGADARARRIDIVRHGDSLIFRNGPGQGTELLRVGALPGATWQSGPDTVRFDGWERVEVPAGSFDAVRVSTRRGVESLPRVEKWWFSPGVGLVRLVSDYGRIYTEELWRVD